jgi:hypothetical protein
MRYLCLIHLDEQELDAMPPGERNALNAAHLDFNDALRAGGHFLLAEALDPPSTASCLRVEKDRPVVTDGPFAETKEIIAGFYVIEARDMTEANAIAAQLPVVRIGLGTVEVRPACKLVVEGREPRWG